MANTPEDLEREISRLWAKVAGQGPAAEAPGEAPIAPAAGSSDIAWETVSMLKRQQRIQSRTWAEILEAKEQALKVLKERQASMERELLSLREKARSGDARLMGEVLDVQARMGEAVKALDAERVKAEQEQESLRNLLDEARKASAADAARWKTEQDRWQKKEQQYLLDLTELQALTARYQEERGRAEDQTKRLSENMKEAKNALEKTLAELLRERRVRQDAEDERAKALKKVDEVQKHFEELSRIWEEERTQWRQLWDRERATWEMQRAEFATWEEGLRREREAWHAEIEAKERDQVRYAEQMKLSLRESSETTSRLAGVMQRLAGLESGRQAAPAPARDWRKLLRPVLAAVALAAAATAAWRWGAGWTFAAVSSQPAAADNPTGMAYDGSFLWVSQWDGRLTAYDPKDRRVALRTVAPKAAGPYRPAALAAGAGFLWSLDAAQARVLKHEAGDPAKIAGSRPSPGPAPSALAFDGKSLWSYDAVNKALYRHEDDGSYKAVALDPAVVATAMLWERGRLWLFDSKAGLVRAYEWKKEALVPVLELSLGESVLALAPETSAGRLLALVGPRGARQSGAFIAYRYGRRASAVFWRNGRN